MSAVPKQHLLSAEEFAALPREGLRTELIEGEVKATALAFDDHGIVSMHLGGLMLHHVLSNDLGEVYAAETGFLIARNPDTVRAPDVAFIQKDRLPPRGGKPGWVRVIPDLVAEVVSSGDRISEVDDKVRMWLDAGVRVVLVAWPDRRTIDVYRPGEPMRTLRESDQLDDGDVVPGLALPLSQVFG